MISFLSGTVKFFSDISRSKDSLTVFSEALGTGYNVYVKDINLYQQDAKIELYIYYHWNQDQGPRLFGFNTQEEKQIFELVLSCSGLGPKVGLSVLNCFTPEQFVNAISFSDIAALNKINGIGKKKAEFMAMQLKDKISSISLGDNNLTSSVYFSCVTKLGNALVSLNYSKKEIDQAVSYVKSNCDLSSATFDIMLRKALSFLSKRL